MMAESHDGTDDSDLIRAAQRGDLGAYERLVLRHQSAVRAFAAVRIASRDDAQDLAQETFVIAWKKLGNFDPDTPLGPWLRTIVRNLVLNHRRKFRAEGVGGHTELDELLGGLGEETASERLAALRQCLNEMGGPALALLEERYIDGVSVRDMATKTGRGYSALTMQLFRLRELLAGCIRERMSAEGGAV
jgi:RNA polymerase sigma-70 factor (ECF subfamily)